MREEVGKEVREEVREGVETLVASEDAIKW